MKEAIGNAFLTGLAILFLSLIMGLLVSSLSYSKAYKAKNKIVSIIEKYNGFSEEAEEEVNKDLYNIGYRSNRLDKKCKTMENGTLLHDAGAGRYDYCVYQVPTSRGAYYHIITYMHFDIPIIGEYMNFGVEGDSRTIYEGLEG